VKLAYEAFTSFSSSYIFPIWFITVVPIEIGSEGEISHIWPIVLVKAGRIFKEAFVNIENELLVYSIGLQRFPGYSEKLVSHLEKFEQGSLLLILCGTDAEKSCSRA